MSAAAGAAVPTKKNGLIVVAHPDDETIFFGGLILRTCAQWDWTVISVTDGDALGMGAHRQALFVKACQALGARHHRCLGFRDRFDERLDIRVLADSLKNSVRFRPAAVFTHSILGEYGHRQHQDVSMAVHKAFANSPSPRSPVYSVAHNAYPSHMVRLTLREYEAKARIYWDIYHEETSKLLPLLPLTAVESFVRVSLPEVTAVYKILSHAKKPMPAPLAAQLKVYAWLEPYFRSRHPYTLAKPIF